MTNEREVRLRTKVALVAAIVTSRRDTKAKTSLPEILLAIAAESGNACRCHVKAIEKREL